MAQMIDEPIAITMESLSAETNFNTKQWKNAPKKVIKKAIELNRIQFAQPNDSKLADSVRSYYYQLKDVRLEDDSNPNKLLSWAVCKKNEAHILTLSYKIKKSNKIGAFTTSSLLQHPCYKKAIKAANAESGDLSREQKHEARDILKDGASALVIADLQPFSMTEGQGTFAYTKSAIKVGVLLGKVPSDETLRKIIPGRGAVKRKVVKIHNVYHDKKKAHLKQLDKQILPAFHVGEDMWTRDGSYVHFVGVIGFEASWKSKSIESFVLAFTEFEEIVDEMSDSDDEYYDSDEEVSGIKIFKTEFKKRIKIKILDTLHLVHYEACLLCPATKDKIYFETFARGKYNKREDAVADLKLRLGDLAVKIVAANCEGIPEEMKDAVTAKFGPRARAAQNVNNAEIKNDDDSDDEDGPAFGDFSFGSMPENVDGADEEIIRA
eukprot:256184_1